MCHVCFQDEGEEGAADVLSRCVECGISVHPPVKKKKKRERKTRSSGLAFVFLC
jgi:hypothetical protein